MKEQSSFGDSFTPKSQFLFLIHLLCFGQGSKKQASKQTNKIVVFFSLDVINVAEFETNLERLQDIYPDMDREVLKDLLLKGDGQLDQAIDLYTAQSIHF